MINEFYVAQKRLPPVREPLHKTVKCLVGLLSRLVEITEQTHSVSESSVKIMIVFGVVWKVCLFNGCRWSLRLRNWFHLCLLFFGFVATLKLAESIRVMFSHAEKMRALNGDSKMTSHKSILTATGIG